MIVLTKSEIKRQGTMTKANGGTSGLSEHEGMISGSRRSVAVQRAMVGVNAMSEMNGQWQFNASNSVI